MERKEERITKENAQFQILNALKTNREKRNKEGFLFEGVRNINNALHYGWKITTFIYSRQNGLSEWAKGILNSHPVENYLDCSKEILRKLSNKEEPSELLAVAKIPKDNLGKIRVSEKMLVVVFDRPGSPGNLGTIIRSCDAFGVDGLIVTGHATDLYDPATISASTGSLFGFPIVRLPSQAELMKWVDEVKEKVPNLQIIGTDEKGDKTHYDFDLTKPTILLVGNETGGLSAGYRAVTDSMIKIPMQGSASSLNVAVATSIIIAEAKRQRI